MKKYIQRRFPQLFNVLRRIKSFYEWDEYENRHYSQEGEDIILSRIFEGKANGFYIDVGAHHPKRFSNTYLFYRRGWRGVNIDAMPGSMDLFNKIRPNDINVEVGVGISKEAEMNYYIFNGPALNTFSRQLSEGRSQGSQNYHVQEVCSVKVKSLSQILDEYVKTDQSLEFMSVDVEGLDYQVLASNDWAKYRPYVVLVEILGATLEGIEKSEIGSFMKELGYVVYAKSMQTVFFIDSRVQRTSE